MQNEHYTNVQIINRMFDDDPIKPLPEDKYFNLMVMSLMPPTHRVFPEHEHQREMVFKH